MRRVVSVGASRGGLFSRRVAYRGNRMSTGTKQPPRDSKGWWKTRYTMLVLNTLGLGISYATRVNISVAIVDMVNATALQQREMEAVAGGGAAPLVDPDACPGQLQPELDLETQGLLGRRQDGEFIWDKQMQGEILAGFYYGYTLGHIPGGVLADRFGGKVVLLAGILVSSLLAALTPPSAWAGYYALFANRVCQGLAQGGIIPAIQTTVCRWAPDHERSLFSIVFLGMFTGNLVSMMATGALCEIAWPLSFYVFGGVGVLWCVFWFLQAADSPAQHPYIDPAERSYIEATIESAAKTNLPVPWKSIVKTPAIWALIAIMITFDWSFYLLITSLPQYLAEVLHYDIRSNGIISAIPNVTGAAGSLMFVWLTNFMLRKEFVSKLWTLRIINALGTLVPAAALLVVPLAGCESNTIIVMLALIGLFTASDNTGCYLNMQAIAPNYAGTIVGIVNMFGNLTGIAIPYVVGAFTAIPTRASWNTVFYLSAGVATVSYLIYAVFTTTEEQPWNVPPSERAHKANKNDGIDNTAFDGGLPQTAADEDTTQRGHREAMV